MKPVAYIDIETASHPAWLALRLLEAQPADPEAWALEHAADGAKSPLSGLITCVSVLRVEDAEAPPSPDELPEAVVITDATQEGDLLRWLHEQLAGADLVVGHNIRDFDAPFVRARALSWGLSALARRLYAPKPYGPPLVDTLDADLCPRPRRDTKGWSLTALAGLLGVPVQPTTPGSEVPRAWYERRFDAVRDHNCEDVRVLRAVHHRLLGGVT